MKKEQQFHYIILPTLEMRDKPNNQSEVVSQALFSENLLILEEKPGWLKIHTVIDNYQGWVKKEGVSSRKTPFMSEPLMTPVITNRLATHLYEHQDTIYGPLLTLPFESRLAAIDFKNDKSRWLSVHLPDSRKAYIQRGDVTTALPKIDCETLCTFSRTFLGIPYTWGGRSSFGYDCSGFVQMLYRQMGVFLPRDSQDQLTFLGFEDCPVDVLNPGDLIIFGFSYHEIQHVGLALGNGNFIHTSAVTENMPYIRMSNIHDSAWNGLGYYPYSFGRTLKSG